MMEEVTRLHEANLDQLPVKAFFTGSNICHQKKRKVPNVTGTTHIILFDLMYAMNYMQKCILLDFYNETIKT